MDNFYIWFLGTIIVYALVRQVLLTRRRALESVSGPLLLATYVRGGGLVKMAEGEVEGLPYVFMATTGAPGPNSPAPATSTVTPGKLSEVLADGMAGLGAKAQQQSREGRGIMYIQLPYKSDLHLLAHGGKDSEFEALLRHTQLNNSVVPVVLEGDFPSYFNLYSDPSHEVELRQVLDPATMAFLVDFCTENDWELYQDHLYMVRRPGATAGNDTPLPEDAKNFARRILPTLKALSHPA